MIRASLKIEERQEKPKRCKKGKQFIRNKKGTSIQLALPLKLLMTSRRLSSERNVARNSVTEPRGGRGGRHIVMGVASLQLWLSIWATLQEVGPVLYDLSVAF